MASGGRSLKRKATDSSDSDSGLPSRGKQPLKRTKRHPRNYRDVIVSLLRSRVLAEGIPNAEEVQRIVAQLEGFINRLPTVELNFDDATIVNFNDYGPRVIRNAGLDEAKMEESLEENYCNICDLPFDEARRVFNRFITPFLDECTLGLNIVVLLTLTTRMAIRVLHEGYPDRVAEIARFAMDFADVERNTFFDTEEQWGDLMQSINAESQMDVAMDVDQPLTGRLVRQPSGGFLDQLEEAFKSLGHDMPSSTLDLCADFSDGTGSTLDPAEKNIDERGGNFYISSEGENSDDCNKCADPGPQGDA